MYITIQKGQKNQFFDDAMKEVKQEIFYPDRGFFMKTTNGYESSNGNSCSSFTVALYDIPRSSILEIRYVSDSNKLIVITY